MSYPGSTLALHPAPSPAPILRRAVLTAVTLAAFAVSLAAERAPASSHFESAGPARPAGRIDELVFTRLAAPGV